MWHGSPTPSRGSIFARWLSGAIIVPALFITATGTDIGKTFVTTGLIRALRRHGRRVAALKPIATGFDQKNFATSDAALLLEACGRDVDFDAITAISPWRFAAPFSPDIAAAQENKVIDVAAVHRFCVNAIAEADDVLLIEGIGGLMVPLDAKATVCDLIAALKVPTILVAGTYLGSLSHTLTALEVAQKRDLPIAALVLNETKNSSVTMEATRESLSHFWKGSIVTIPHNAPNASAFEKLMEFLPPGSSVA
jgi:dethiobiotin synthetase